MILFGTHYWTHTRPVWPLLEAVAQERRYGELLALTDDEEEIVRRIVDYEPEGYRR